MRKKRGPSRRGERPLRKRGGVHGAVGVVVGQGQRPRVALVGVVGVVHASSWSLVSTSSALHALLAPRSLCTTLFFRTKPLAHHAHHAHQGHTGALTLSDDDPDGAVDAAPLS